MAFTNAWLGPSFPTSSTASYSVFRGSPWRSSHPYHRRWWSPEEISTNSDFLLQGPILEHRRPGDLRKIAITAADDNQYTASSKIIEAMEMERVRKDTLNSREDLVMDIPQIVLDTLERTSTKITDQVRIRTHMETSSRMRLSQQHREVVANP